MKKIVLPVFLAAVIIACAWYVGANTFGPRIFHGKTPGGPNNVNVSNGSLNMNVSTGNSSILHGSDGSMLLHIDIEAMKAEIKGRNPLNLALVIDRSGSMADAGKLEYARKAAMDLVDLLGPEDRVAVVIYDDEAQVLVPSTMATNTADIKRRIAAVEPGGSTNLSGGLILGQQEVKGYFDKERINRVIILSDGLANRGITEQDRLRSMVSGWRESGISVTAMGLGADFNENLMMGLADSSGGHYFFIESPSQLAAIFEEELNTLMQTVSDNTKVYIKLADGVKFVKAPGYDATVKGSDIEIPLGSFRSGEHRVIFVHLQTPTSKLGKTDVANVKIAYRDLMQNSRPVEGIARIGVDCVEDVATVEQNRNIKVEGDAYWATNASENAQAIDDVEQGRKEDAEKWYKNKIEEIRHLNSTYQNPQLETQAKKYEQELDELKDVDAPSSEEGKVFLKRGKANQRLDALGYMQ